MAMLTKELYFFLPKQDYFFEFLCILKEIGSRWTFSRQPVTKYFETFLPIGLASIHHKRNKTKLELPETVYYLTN